MSEQFADVTAQTHEVINQPSPLENYNAYTTDTLLRYWVTQFGGQWGEEHLSRFGHQVGHELLAAGFEANKHLPEFQSHDRFGQRIDRVDYHPAYHQLMSHAIEQGHCALPWTDKRPGAHVVRGAMAYLHTQADPGSGCPLTMTFASIPAISVQPDVAERWVPKILTKAYDGSNRPWFDKSGLTIGMAMTEKQGGSDVRANTTRAVPVDQSGPGNLYSLVGHKWFCSAPMCDGFLVLAQVNDKLSCFLVPRWREDGNKNPMHIQRLKSKLGNQSNASSEVEFRGAHGWLLGEEGRGVATIIQMVALTRYDCMLGSTALMAQAAKEAIWHTAGRNVFGKNLHQHPLMVNVLADLALEWEAALAISLRMSHALDNRDNPAEAALVRSATSIGKYWICKRAIQHTYEAMECIGGVGYVDENVTARLYREAPVNSIWEGSGNVQCLDLLRILTREPDTLNALLAELEKGCGEYTSFDRALEKLKQQLAEQQGIEARARQLMEQLALLWQAQTLISYGEGFIAEAFVSARLTSDRYHQYGTLPSAIDAGAIVERAMPELNSDAD
ncbi:Putative acyl-CoA dehydrogenase AidB [Saliniradius amylolyticus]|uniref:Acyl-CoA dehydrogenase AidB n=1 Tax=Saliniradius amylolyticus TaxID=2183582 RepID=A0A2S2E6H5_9ALTE|nr:acyl-CoA dehydrogenase family protein [Saliniradius amylolyticus]AWL13132.1 Putative acyl-CoA dehydrogenase AidB [Saliniradius amylolyticus]